MIYDRRAQRDGKMTDGFRVRGVPGPVVDVFGPGTVASLIDVSDVDGISIHRRRVPRPAVRVLAGHRFLGLHDPVMHEPGLQRVWRRAVRVQPAHLFHAQVVVIRDRTRHRPITVSRDHRLGRQNV